MRFFARAVWGLFLCGYTHTAWAFINVESLRLSNEKGVTGSAAINVAGQQGNTDKSTESLTSITIHRSERDELLFLANYQYGSTADIQDTNNGQAHLRYNFFDEQPQAIELFTQYEFDQFKDLISRTLGGADLRQRLYKNPTTAGFVGVGTFYEFQQYTNNIQRQGARGSIYFSYAEKFDERSNLSATVYYQPLFNDYTDYRIRFQTDLDVNLSKHTAINLEYTLALDSWVPPGVKNTDTMYLAGFKMKY